MNVIIVGGGQIGSYIARLLLESDCHVRIIEQRESMLTSLKKNFPEETIIIGDGSDPNVLEDAGIQTADVLAAVTGSDEANLVTTTIAKFEFGVPRVIGRVSNPKNEWLYDASMGVDVKVNQAALLSRIIVDEIDLKNMITLLKLDEGNHSIVQLFVEENSLADGKMLKDLPVPDESVLIAVNRRCEHRVIIPRGETVIQKEDYILALSDDANQKALSALFDAK